MIKVMAHEVIENIKKRMGTPMFLFIVVVLLLIALIGFGRSL